MKKRTSASGKPKTKCAELFAQAGHPEKRMRSFHGKIRGQMLRPVKAKRVRANEKGKRYKAHNSAY